MLVGVSGGTDSLALLHLLLRLASEWELELRAAHVHHGLRGPEADGDAETVERLCAEWGVPLRVLCQDARAAAEWGRLGLEEAARQVRYTALAEEVVRVDASVVAVGHNADDQVETLVMHWLRGAGVAGLRGMAPLSPLPHAVAPGQMLWRPLLTVPRADLAAYLAAVGVEPRQDSTNQDPAYRRNRLRHELLPVLEEYNPNLRATLLRSVEVIRGDWEVLEAALDQQWPEVAREVPGAVTFRWAEFAAMRVGLQRAALRRAVSRLRPGLRDLSLERVDAVVRAVAQAPGAGAILELPGAIEVVLGYGEFTVREREAQTDAGWPAMLAGVEWLEQPVPGHATLAGGWRAEVSLAPWPGPGADIRDGWSAWLNPPAEGEKWVWRRRRPGDRLRPLGMEGRSKVVSDLMIDCKVPAGARPDYPILTSGERVLWVPGCRLSEEARVSDEAAQAVHLRLVHQ